MLFSEDSNIPKPPEGHQWKEVRHDNTVTWVACWQDTITNEMVYVDLGFLAKNQHDFRAENSIDFYLNQRKTNYPINSTFQKQEDKMLYNSDKMPKYVDYEDHQKDQVIPTSSSGVAENYMEMNNQNPKILEQHGAVLDLNPSLDKFELVYLNGPPWTNSTNNIVKKERISYQNASCLTLEFFQADLNSGIYKRIDCIPCQNNVMNIKKNGHLYNVIEPHFNGKWHRARCLGVSKPPKKRKLMKGNAKSDDPEEPQKKRRKNKKHKHKKKEEICI